MKLNTYKNYHICPICNRELPYTRTYFKRKIIHGKEYLHEICKECSDKERYNKEYSNGLLLCHKCNQYKDINEFSAEGSSSPLRNYRRYICKDCYTKFQRDKDINLNDDDKLIKCLRLRFLGARERALKLNIDFNITLDYIKELWNKQNGICALSGIPMTYLLKEGRIPTNISIDKIDRTKGYTIGNIQLVCMACNQIKSDLTEEEMYNFCKKIVEIYENKNNKNTRPV